MKFEGHQIELNSSERRAGIDRWPETPATITSIEQPYNDPEHDFLSVVGYTFKDATGEYFAGKFEMRTCDLPDDLMTGGSVTIRYDPQKPDKTWCAYDYWRAGLGRFQSFDHPIALLSLVIFLLVALVVIEAFHIRLR